MPRSPPSAPLASQPPAGAPLARVQISTRARQGQWPPVTARVWRVTLLTHGVLADLGPELRGLRRAHGRVRQGWHRAREPGCRHPDPHGRDTDGAHARCRCDAPASAAVRSFGTQLPVPRAVGTCDRGFLVVLFPRPERRGCGARGAARQAQCRAGGTLRGELPRREARAGELDRDRDDRDRRLVRHAAGMRQHARFTHRACRRLPSCARPQAGAASGRAAAAAVTRLSALATGLGGELRVLRKAALLIGYALPTLATRLGSEATVLGETALLIRHCLAAHARDLTLTLSVHRGEAAVGSAPFINGSLC